MIVTSKIKLDMAQPGTANPVYAVQGDGNTRAVVAELLANGSSWAPDDGWEAAITYRKPDGTKGLYNLLDDGSSAINISGSTATVILAQQMMTVPGAVRAAIVFNNQRLDQLTSFPFLVSVSRNQFAGAQQSEDYIRLQWLEDKLEEYLRKAADSGAFDGAPGADGHTPVYGVDYGTPEQIAGIAQSAAEILQPEVNQIKDDLSDLAPAGAAVGQLFRVAAIREDGKYTMEPVDFPSGGCAVDDVQINGKSIVQDGVANIPYASDNNVGLVRVSRYRGMAILTGGIIVPKKPMDSYIDNRNDGGDVSNTFTVTLSTIDYSVKTAMCDGKGASWTDAERIAALLRMGCTVDDNGFVKWTPQEVAE